MELTAKPFENRTILVLEDDDNICRELAEQLRDNGARVLGPTASAFDALVMLEFERVDAALIDIHANPDSSIPVAARLIARDIPFVFATSEKCSILPAAYDGYLVDNLNDLHNISRTLFPPH